MCPIDSETVQLLKRCTVKITALNCSTWGTGFLVAPRLILTCAHVVGLLSQSTFTIHWHDSDYCSEATILEIHPESDLALLGLTTTPADAIYVLLDNEIAIGDRLCTYGYGDDYSNGTPITFEYKGLTNDNAPSIKFEAGRIPPGLSGAPLLNQRTGRVCGIFRCVDDRDSESTE